MTLKLLDEMVNTVPQEIIKDFETLIQSFIFYQGYKLFEDYVGRIKDMSVPTINLIVNSSMILCSEDSFLSGLIYYFSGDNSNSVRFGDKSFLAHVQWKFVSEESIFILKHI